MRIVTSLLERIEGIELFPLISLAIFLIVFLLAMVYTFTMKKQHSEEYRNFPLDETDSSLHQDIS